MSSQNPPNVKSNPSYIYNKGDYQGVPHNKAVDGAQIGTEDGDTRLKQGYKKYSEIRRTSALFALFKRHQKEENLDEVVGVLLGKLEELRKSSANYP
ncbi:hypothetical protein NMY22_g18319 [Coprinellus aureogranulatus]|nr:hypothetical protein NMY22_g18319 [Coprinellus aureogranulatus]